MFAFGRGVRPRSLSIISPLFAVVALVTPSALAQVTVQVNELRQTMDGFGASSAFFSEDISEEDAEFLFSEETGIGLSLLRVRIHHEDAVTMELETAKKAKMWGARVWAAPWTPPPAWKTNNELNAKPMAHLRSQNFGDYANYLADFAEYMADEGVPLVAITPQNEPDWEADWDGCLWSPSEMVTFIGQHLGPVFEERGLDVMIVAPDTAHLRNLPGFVDAILANADAKKYTAGISTHPYSAADFDMTWSVPRDNDLFFWQTEISQENFDPRDYPDPTMTSALTMLRMVHDHLTQLWMGAWNWWNLTAVTENYEDDPNRQNPALIQNGERFKRAYALGNFAKFVRPGFQRVEATPSPATDVLVSAYRNDSRVVVVAINAGGSAASQTFTLEGDLGGTVADAVPWVTSDTLSLEAQTAVAITNGAFQFSLPAKSVTTFVVDIDVAATGGTGGMAGTAGTGGTGADPNDPYAPRSGPFKMLVYSRTEGFEHASIPAGQQMLRSIAEDYGFEVTVTTENTEITLEGLSQYEIIFFMNPTGDIFDAPHEAAFEQWMTTKNGAFAGSHSATDTERDWAFYKEVTGQYYDLHDNVDPGTIQWEASALNFVAVVGLPSPWQRNEEWYRFNSYQSWSSKEGFQILSKVTTNAGGTRPVSYIREYGNFRSFYSSLGHEGQTFQDANVKKHFAAGILWAVRREAMVQ